MISYLFRLNEGASIEDAQEELLSLQLTDIYCIEDDAIGEVLIGGLSPKKIDTSHLRYSLLSEEKLASAVDWDSQWSLFAEDFREGKAHINLSRFGSDQTLLLNPGPGFGDLSHPTTYLMLQLMHDSVQSQSVIDIGCGSGILTLAALFLGAKSAIGIDIDPEVIEHAKQNARLNHKKTYFGLKIPDDQPTNNILLMNMILPEQKVVMKKRSELNRLAAEWITSGILSEQKELYLDITDSWGWKLTDLKERDGWLGMKFKGG